MSNSEKLSTTCFKLISPCQFVNQNSPASVFPLRKLYTEQMFVLLHTKLMRLRNLVDTQPVRRSKRLNGYAIYIQSGPD